MISVGCSWTWGHGLESHETYSAHLQNRLDGWQVINGGHCGADVDFAIFTAMSLIESMPVDFVVFQLSSLDRITLGTDGFENFLEDRFYDGKDESIYYEDTESQYKRLIGVTDNVKTKYTDGSYSAEDHFKHEEFKWSGMKNLNYKKYRTFVSVLTENVSYSTYHFQKTFSNLLIFENYLKQKNIRSLYFSYLPVSDDAYSSKYFKLFQTNVTMIKESWKTWLHKTYPNHNYYIDLSHINNEGNKVLAEEYLMPYIEKML
jgi:hypothetical protein